MEEAPISFEEVLHTVLASLPIHASSLHLLNSKDARDPAHIVFSMHVNTVSTLEAPRNAGLMSTPALGPGGEEGTTPISLDLLRTGILSCVRRRLQSAISTAWAAGHTSSAVAASASRSANNSNAPSEHTTPQKQQQHDGSLPAGLFQPLASRTCLSHSLQVMLKPHGY